MKSLALFALLLGAVASVFGADALTTAKVQQGQFSTVSLFGAGRISGKGAPDGVQFFILVLPTPNAKGAFNVKETRDFLVGGESYREKTLVELAKAFEPSTSVDSAEKFFASRPAIRNRPGNLAGGYVLSIAIAGAKILPEAKIDVTIQVGFGTEVEGFTFHIPVPPLKAAAPEK